MGELVIRWGIRWHDRQKSDTVEYPFTWSDDQKWFAEREVELLKKLDRKLRKEGHPVYRINIRIKKIKCRLLDKPMSIG